MKKLLLNTAIVLFISFSAYLSAQQNDFSKVFYDAGSTNGYSVVRSFDNGYMIAGTNSGNAFVMKIDSAGSYLWSKDFGNSGFNKIISTSDSCFVMAGSICVKIKSNGDTLWSKSFLEETLSLQQTNDHGFILTGYKNNSNIPYNNIIAIKLESNGNLQWKKTITVGNHSNIGYSVKQMPDSSYVILGYAENGPPFDFNPVLIKLTTAGTISWCKKYNRSTPVNSFPVDMEITPDGIVSYLTLEGSMALMKTDFSGTVLWSKNYLIGGGGNCVNCGSPKIRRTSDGGYVFVNGTAIGMGGQSMLKVDSIGNPEWGQNLFMYPIDVSESNDNGFLVLGNGPLIGVSPLETYNPQIGIIKLDSTGHGLNCTNYDNGLTADNDSLISTVIIATSISGGIGNPVYPLLSTPSIIENIGCVSFLGELKKSGLENNFSIAPNPFNNQTTITFAEEQRNTNIKIIDVLGKEIRAKSFSGEQFVIEKGEMKQGIYFVQILSSKEIINKKIIVQ